MCPPGKPLAYINLHESSVVLDSGSRRGYVRLPNGVSRSSFLRRERLASLAQRRTYLSLAAMLADDAEVHRLLPQISVCNSRSMPLATYRAVQQHLRHNSRHFCGAQVCLDRSCGACGHSSPLAQVFGCLVVRAACDCFVCPSGRASGFPPRHDSVAHDWRAQTSGCVQFCASQEGDSGQSRRSISSQRKRARLLGRALHGHLCSTHRHSPRPDLGTCFSGLRLRRWPVRTWRPRPGSSGISREAPNCRLRLALL